MYEKLDNCPSCDHPKFDNYLICEDHLVSHESFALVKCPKCQLIFTNPRPDNESLHKYYKSDQYVSHTSKGNSLINVIYKIVRSYTLKAKRKLIEKYVHTGTVLDFGCGTGDFLSTCEKAGWTGFGLEVDHDARKIASTKVRGSVVDDLKALPEGEKFDIITAWHVIEHVSDLKGTLKGLRKKLSKNGFLIIAVPNANSYDASHYKEQWAAYDVPRHLYHFSTDSLKTLLKTTKFKVETVLPVKVDAYYVSLLSEKYITGKTRLFKAFFQGLRSNKKALKTGEYSSLVYVITK